MKKMLTIGLVALYASGFAQGGEDLTVEKLINSRNFVFVVADIQKKPGYGGVKAGPENPVRFSNLNSATISPSKSLQITSIPLNANGSYLRDYYYSSDGAKDSYFKAYNINTGTPQKKPADSLESAVFLVQKPDVLLVKPQNPMSLSEIEIKAFTMAKKDAYTLKSLKKNKGNWLLTYAIGKGKNERTIYLLVTPDGKAVLEDDPTYAAKTQLIGFIAPLETPGS